MCCVGQLDAFMTAASAIAAELETSCESCLNTKEYLLQEVKCCCCCARSDQAAVQDLTKLQEMQMMSAHSQADKRCIEASNALTHKMVCTACLQNPQADNVVSGEEAVRCFPANF